MSKSKIIMIKRGPALWAHNDEARKVLRPVKEGKELVVVATAPRNIKQLALFQILISKIAESGAWESSRDLLIDFVKYKTGWVRVVVVDGKRHFVPKSLAVESMTQAQFQEFFDRAIRIICEELLGSDDHKTLRDEVISSVTRRHDERGAA